MPIPITKDQVTDDLWNIITDYDEEVIDAEGLVEWVADYVMNVAEGNFTPYLKK